MRAEIVGVSLCCEPGHAAYIPLAHDYAGRACAARPCGACSRLSSPLLEDPTRAKVGTPPQVPCACAAQPRHRARRHALRHDARVATCSTAPRHGTTSTRPRRAYLGIDTIRLQRHRGQGSKTADVQPGAGRHAPRSTRPRTRTSRRGCTERSGRKLVRLPPAQSVYEDIERPLAAGADRDGAPRVCLIDAEHAPHARASRSRRACSTLEQAAHAAAGTSVQPRLAKAAAGGAVRQAAAAREAAHATGQPSTAEDVLEELAESSSCRASSSSTAALAKLKSTYTDKLPAQMQPAHRARAHLLSPGGRRDGPAVIGRPEPAEHPDPHRRKVAASARRSWRRPGYVIVAADYSQIELRIMAHLSGDEGLLRAFARRTRRSPGDGRGGVRPRRGRGRRGSAPRGEGHQLRTHLRDVGLRARAPARHRARRSAAVRRPLLPALSRRAALHAGARAQARERRVRRNGVRAASVPAGHQCRATRSCASTRSARRSTRRCRARAADIIKRAMIAVHSWLERRRILTRGSSCRCTTNWSSRCRSTRSMKSHERCARAHGGGGGAACAAESRCRSRSQLG